MLLPDRYIAYRLEWNPSRGKWEKIPVGDDGTRIDAHDMRHWRAAADVIIPQQGGLGFVLNGDGWFLLDIDDALGQDGQWQSWATEVFTRFPGALGEVSVSGTGLHVMGRCDPAAMSEHRNRWSNMEFYTTGRFVALSAQGPSPIGGTWSDVDWTPVLQTVVPKREELGELPDGVDPRYTGPESDDELLRIMLASSSASSQFGEKLTFAELWNADVTRLAAHYPDGKGGFDHSQADMVLMSHLAFYTGKDAPRMERLFARSGLVRDKWTKRQDYRHETVNKARRLCKNVYDKPRKTESTQSVDGIFLTTNEMQEYFKGCVYVQDMHRVLTPRGVLMRPEQFRASYGGHLFQMMPDGTKETTNAFEALTECRAHRFPQAERICFRPERSFQDITNGEINVYDPFTPRMTPGDVSPWLDLLQRMIPAERDRAIITSWMKGVVQNPGRKALWSLVIQGAEGNGKSTIGEILRYTMGEHYAHVARAKEIGGTFNGWQVGKLLIIVPEVHMNGRRELLDDLKTNITDYTLGIRMMHQTEVNMHIPTNWFFTTNYRDAVIKSKQDRRYSIFYCAQQDRSDVERDFPPGYFARFFEWLRADGYAHIAHWLMTTPPDPEFDFTKDCVNAPHTTSADEAIELTIGGIESEIQEAVDAERVGFRGGWISSYHLDALLKQHGLRVSRPKLGVIMKGMGYVAWGRAQKPIINEGATRPRLWRLDGVDGHTEDYLISQGQTYQ